MKHFRITLLLLIAICCVNLRAQNVSNVVVEQQGDQIVVSYTLDKEADVQLTMVKDGKYRVCRTVFGDIGQNVSSGRKTVTWNVLSDMDDLIGEAYFEVSASKSTRAKQASALARQRELQKKEKMRHIYPFAGIDCNVGLYGLGIDIYWPWVTYRPSRFGSYMSYTYCSKDWQDDTVDGFHMFCVGATVTLSPHVAWFIAPGFSYVKYEGENTTTTLRDYESREYTTTNYSGLNNVKFACETGLGFRFLYLLMGSVKVSYPWYVGVGLGFEFVGK